MCIQTAAKVISSPRLPLQNPILWEINPIVLGISFYIDFTTSDIHFTWRVDVMPLSSKNSSNLNNNYTSHSLGGQRFLSHLSVLLYNPVHWSGRVCLSLQAAVRWLSLRYAPSFRRLDTHGALPSAIQNQAWHHGGARWPRCHCQAAKRCPSCPLVATVTSSRCPRLGTAQAWHCDTPWGPQAAAWR